MKQGEIWLINLDPTIGAEIKKNRPALIVNHDSLGKLPLRIIVPVTVTEWKEKFSIAPWMVKITPNSENGLAKISSFDCFQVRSVSQERFVKKIGEVGVDEMNSVKSALTKVLSIES
jgi:mRNA interferase MazF